LSHPRQKGCGKAEGDAVCVRVDVRECVADGVRLAEGVVVEVEDLVGGCARTHTKAARSAIARV